MTEEKAAEKKTQTPRASGAAKAKTAPRAVSKTADKTAGTAKAKASSSRRTAAKSAPKAAPAEKIALTDPSLYTNRELSWLDFNRRVLETAMEKDRPLLDRVKFLSIFATNLDEFFMVRVANIYQQYQTGTASSGADQLTPAKQLDEIRRKTTALSDEAAEYWLSVLKPALASAGVRVLTHTELTRAQKRHLQSRFENEIYPLLTPQAIDPGHPFPRISNVSVNFLMELEDESGVQHYARLRVPHNLPRFFRVPTGTAKTEDLDKGSRIDVIPVEEIISEFLPQLFPGFTLSGKGMFRITRNTDVEIEEDEAEDLLEAVKDSVTRRQFGGVVRLEVEDGMPENLTEFLVRKMKVKPFLFKVKGPMAFSGFMALDDLERPDLKEPPYFAGYAAGTQPASRMFERIARNDILLYHPYQTFESVVDFVRQAARDPQVLGIKMTLYRVGSNSPIVEALLAARLAGKQVTAVVELKARFDEERNITWAEEMEKQGVNVVYGFVGMKVHAKLCLVIRKENSGIRTYVHIGTGNYNPGSARHYTDLGLLTANPEITADVTDLFNVMTGYAVRKSYRRLLVSPVTMRSGLTKAIREEIARHKKEGNGRIIVKCNQLVDAEMIRELYKASRAGVKVDCLVRGICCLRPGIPGVSENITVRAILGRFLEHARAYWFGPLEKPQESRCYIGSADLMGRNLDHRFEVVTPLRTLSARKRIAEEVLKLQLADTARTWILKKDTYVRLKPADGKKALNSQDKMAAKYRG